MEAYNICIFVITPLLAGLALGKITYNYPNFEKYFLKLVLYFFIPCLIVYSSRSITNKIQIEFFFVFYVFFVFLVSLLVGLAYSVIRRHNSQNRNFLISSACLMNCGYIGIPATASVGGQEFRELAILFTIVYTPLSIILSSYLFSKTKKNIFIIFTDIYIISFLVGIIYGQLKVPSYIFNLLTCLANMSPTMMLIAFGWNVSKIKLSAFHLVILEFVIVRFVAGLVSIFPLLLNPFYQTSNAISVLTIECLMPIGLYPFFIAKKNNIQTNKFSKSIVISTLFWSASFLIFFLIVN